MPSATCGKARVQHELRPEPTRGNLLTRMIPLSGPHDDPPPPPQPSHTVIWLILMLRVHRQRVFPIYFKKACMKKKKRKPALELLGMSLHSAGRNLPATHQSETREMRRSATQTANKSRRARSTWMMSATEGHSREAVGSDGSGDEIIN